MQQRCRTEQRLLLAQRNQGDLLVALLLLCVIGLLTAGLLARFPLASLRGWDLHPLRREAAAFFGVTAEDPRETPPASGSG